MGISDQRKPAHKTGVAAEIRSQVPDTLPAPQIFFEQFQPTSFFGLDDSQCSRFFER